MIEPFLLALIALAALVVWERLGGPPNDQP